MRHTTDLDDPLRVIVTVKGGVVVDIHCNEIGPVEAYVLDYDNDASLITPESVERVAKLESMIEDMATVL